jgi:hypothetical protein
LGRWAIVGCTSERRRTCAIGRTRSFEFARDRRDRRPLRVVLALVLQHRAHRPLPNLRGYCAVLTWPHPLKERSLHQTRGGSLQLPARVLRLQLVLRCKPRKVVRGQRRVQLSRKVQNPCQDQHQEHGCRNGDASHDRGALGVGYGCARGRGREHAWRAARRTCTRSALELSADGLLLLDRLLQL